MSIKIEEKAILLTAESKPYDFNGNSGTSHKVRISINGEIYSCNSNASQVTDLAPLSGKEGTVVLEILSRKEALSLRVVSFEAE